MLISTHFIYRLDLILQSEPTGLNSSNRINWAGEILRRKKGNALQLFD